MSKLTATLVFCDKPEYSKPTNSDLYKLIENAGLKHAHLLTAIKWAKCRELEYSLHNLTKSLQNPKQNAKYKEGDPSNAYEAKQLEEYNKAVENPAYILIVRNAVQAILNTENTVELKAEQDTLPLETKMWFNNRYVKSHKHSHRYFSETAQEANVAKEQLYICDIKTQPLLNTIRCALPVIVDDAIAANLNCEGFYYQHDYEKLDIRKDAHRHLNIGVHYNKTTCLRFVWRYNNIRTHNSNEMVFYLNDGDMYFLTDNISNSSTYNLAYGEEMYVGSRHSIHASEDGIN